MITRILFLITCFTSASAQSRLKHYVFFSKDREAIHEASFYNNPDLEGAQITYPWKRLEKQRDQYDFSEIEADLQFLLQNGKRLFIQIQDVTFDSLRYDVPAYIMKDPEFHGGVTPQYYVVNNRPYKAGWVSRRWDPAVADRFRKLIIALGGKFNGRIEGINLPETAIDLGGNETFSDEIYRDELKKTMKVLKASFNRSVPVLYANFMPRDSISFLKDLYDYAREIGLGMGGPDIKVYRKAQMNNSYPLIRSMQGIVPTAMAVQEGNYNLINDRTGKQVTLEEIMDFATNYLQLSYIFWCREEPYYSQQVLPMLRSAFTLTKEQAKEDFKWLRFALEYCHPRLYKYDHEITVNARFDSLINLIDNEISGIAFLSHVNAMNASVHCGHLYTIPQGRLAKQVLEKKVMPFYIKLLDDKIYLLNNCSNEKISNGSLILSINGRSSAEILSAILPIIAADGYIETRKRKLLERYFYPAFNGFDLYYHLRVDSSSVFKIAYIDYKTQKKRTATLNGVSREERRQVLNTRYKLDELKWFKTPSPAFEIRKDSNYAILTISRSFYDKNIDPDYDSVLLNGFRAMEEKRVTNLIIDLRGNEGGSEHHESELISYLYDQPFKLYQNIYVSRLDYRPLKPIIHAAEKDTSRLLDKNEDEWMRKIRDDLWINNYDYYEGLQLQPPKKNVFRGNIYVLMNGACFSSTAALIANIRNTTKAVFIGEESGGVYEGPTGGQTIPIILPNSKIMVRISPNMNIGYMYQKHPIGRGVFPDHPVSYQIADVLTNRDLEMEAAKTLIRSIN